MRDVAIRGRWPPQPRPADRAHDSAGSVAAASAAAAAAAAAGGGSGGAATEKTPRMFLRNSEGDDGIRMELRVGVFSSESVGEHFR